MWYVRIGSRLRGPFNEDQLKLLRKRGELSSVHQVSTDQKNWQAAGELFKQWETPVVQEPTPTAPVEQKAAPTGEGWYFASPKGETIGPMPKQQLVQLAIAGQLTERTLVYGPGFPSWTPAAKIDFLAGNAKRVSRGLVLPIMLVSCLTLALIGTASYVIYLAVNRPGDQGTTIGRQDVSEPKPDKDEKDVKPREPTGADVKINSSTHKRIKEALARVQIVERVHFANGSVVELPIAHGTGFCVTPTGYFLTNRHVVDPYSDKVDEGTMMVGGTPRAVKRDMAIVLFIQGIRFTAKLVHASSRFDLAVVKTDRLQKLPYFELSTNAEPDLLTEVYALGFPGVAATPTEAEAAALETKFTAEYLRAIADKCTVTAESQLPESAFGHSAVSGSINKASRTDNGQLFIYHSATIFGGNSGGPLVDKKGVVVGINTAVRSRQSVSETTLSDGSKKILAVEDEKLNMAYLTSQFHDELKAYVPEKLHWK